MKARNLMAALLVGGLLTAVLPRAATADEPDLVLRGTLTGADHQTWISVPFAVPENIERITVHFNYTGRDQRTTVDLGLIGPDGFMGHDGLRGYSGGNKSEFTVSAHDATPSYSPGPIRAGNWALLLGVPNIRKETISQYTAEIFFTHDGAIHEAGLAPTRLSEESRWYRGDLHMHTGQSDGSCPSQAGRPVPCPLFLTAQAAAARGLDFIAISEHNTPSHANDLRELQGYFDHLLLLPAREITTAQGHANLFGHFRPVDFRLGTPTVPDWNSLLRAVSAPDALVSINHPIRPSGEDCMGCGWTPRPAVDFSLIQGVEVANSGDPDTPYSGIPFWQQQLDAGHHLTAVGGSDNHNAALDLAKADSRPIGQPLTVVHADSLSTEGLLNAIRAGRVFVDVRGDTHSLLDLEGRDGTTVVHMGGTLPGRSGQPLSFTLTVSGVDQPRITLLLDGTPLAVTPPTFTWRADGHPHTLRAEVRDHEGHLALVGNPIYIGPLPPSLR